MGMHEDFGRRSVVTRLRQQEAAEGADGAAAQAAPGAPATPAAQPAFVAAAEKYQKLGEIGSGGMGDVILVHDRDLRRDVAMKLLRPSMADRASMKLRFVAEAQMTSQLDHPGIPPVHDIGISPDGNVYFTMKVVRGSTLTRVLRDLFLGTKEARREYTLHRLITILERIAEAVHFAHERGVIHRDLKPDNVMLGEYGEVHVMDWGLAKPTEQPISSTTETDDTLPPGGTRVVDPSVRFVSQAGVITGTLPYMSPEQARGEAVDHRVDVYALGAILYEILTLQPAFDGGAASMAQRVRDNDYPPVETRNPRRQVPDALAALQRRAMARVPDDRPASAALFAAELRSFLDGRAEKDRRHVDAERFAAQGREAADRYLAAQESVVAAEQRAAVVARQFKAWHSVEEKAPLLDANDAVAAARRAVVVAFAETTRLLEGALLAEPENAAARSLLADLWRRRLDDAERRREDSDADFALHMLRRYDDGRLAAHIAGDGALEITSDPPGATVTIQRFESRRGILHPGAPRSLGPTPVAAVPLPPGSYLCILRRTGFADVRYPVYITRNRRWQGIVKLRTHTEIGDGFVYVPGGRFTYGEGRDTVEAAVHDFAIAEDPVSFGEWAEFLAAIEAADGLDAARARVPRVRGDGDYMERLADGRWTTLPTIVEGPARERCIAAHGADFEMRIPVAGVTWDDAVAYLAWKTKVTGREWRLPTEQEREKAARGVDGRAFPWGDLADATLCKCTESRNERAQPEPTGCFPTATSVYGMVDAAGNSWDWTDSWFDDARTFRVMRGGGWVSTVNGTRCAGRRWAVAGDRNTGAGLRAARSLGS